MNEKQLLYEKNILTAQITALNKLQTKIIRVINDPPVKGAIMCQGNNVNELFSFNLDFPAPQHEIILFFKAWLFRINSEKSLLEEKLDYLLTDPDKYADLFLKNPVSVPCESTLK